MTAFDTAMQKIFSDRNLAVDALYHPAGGPSVSCRVIFEEDILLQPPEMMAQIDERGTTIEARLVDLGKEPDRDETFVIGSDTYTVQRIDENDGLVVRMIVI